jgi:pimeloyl-ACP methyl ester carboxylesterase
MILLLAAAAMTAFSPMLSFNSLLYPERIDSLYLRQEQMNFETQARVPGDSTERRFIYSPAQLGARYMHLSFTLPDSAVLRGWLVMDTKKPQGPLLLIVPDAGEGAIRYLYALKVLADRGINAAVIDLRAQGYSDGTTYQFARQPAIDLHYLLKQLRLLPFVTGVSLMGNGTGAAAAMETALEQGIADALILRNPPEAMLPILKRTARAEWGALGTLFLPGMIRSYEKKCGIHTSDYDYKKLIPLISIPKLFMVSAYASPRMAMDARTLYDLADQQKRKWMTDSTRVKLQNGAMPDKKYIDQVAAFVNANTPKGRVNSRFKRMALFQ